MALAMRAWAPSNPRDSEPKAAVATRPDLAQAILAQARSETCSLFGQWDLASTGTQHSTIHTSRLRGYGQQGMGAMEKCSGLGERQSEELPERGRGNRVVRLLATMVEHLARKSAVCKPHRMATKLAKAEEEGTGDGSQLLSQSGASRSGFTATRSRCWSHPPSGRYCQRRR